MRSGSRRTGPDHKWLRGVRVRWTRVRARSALEGQVAWDTVVAQRIGRREQEIGDDRAGPHVSN